MGANGWVSIGICAVTVLNGWAQFWVKERIFNAKEIDADPVLSFIRGRGGIGLLVLTACISICAVVMLAFQVTSPDPLTRFACAVISALTVLALLNWVLVLSLWNLRKVAELKKQVEAAKHEAMMWAMSMV